MSVSNEEQQAQYEHALASFEQFYGSVDQADQKAQLVRDLIGKDELVDALLKPPEPQARVRLRDAFPPNELAKALSDAGSIDAVAGKICRIVMHKRKLASHRQPRPLNQDDVRQIQAYVREVWVARNPPPQPELIPVDFVGEVYLDTETTGLGAVDQVVSVTVLGSTAQTLLDTFVALSHGMKMTPKATEITGITDDALVGAPSFCEVWRRLGYILKHAKKVWAYNAEFDRRLIQQTCSQSGVFMSSELGQKFRCAMLWVEHERCRMKLTEACQLYKVDTAGCSAHSSLGATHMLFRLLCRLKQQRTHDAGNDERRG